jgi:hypothetical protein
LGLAGMDVRVGDRCSCLSHALSLVRLVVLLGGQDYLQLSLKRGKLSLW